jgi:large subunit ribosomal protein L31e
MIADKVILEREYIVPLRRKVNLSSKYRRARKAVNVLRDFIERHMKVYDNAHKLIKLDRYLNEELWARGIEKPPAKITVKCKKFESGKVIVELANIPEYVKWKMQKAVKISVKKEEKKEEKTEEKKVDEEEKKKSEVEAGLIKQEQEAKEAKHVVKDSVKGQKIKKQPIQRMALQK